MTDKLDIFTAKVDITPCEPCHLAGFASRREPARPGNNRLNASITALKCANCEYPDLVLLSLDTLFLDDAFVEDLGRALEWPEFASRCIAVASHCHGAPNLLASPITGCPVNTEYRQQVLEALKSEIAPLLTEADHWHRITEIASGETIWRGNVSRRQKGMYVDLRSRRIRHGCHFGQDDSAPADPRLRAIKFSTAKGIVAMWWCYAAHPAYFPDKDVVTADYPEVLNRHLIKEAPELVVSFFPGLSGSVIPRVSRRPRTGSIWRDLLFRLPFIPVLGAFTVDQFNAWTSELIEAFDQIEFIVDKSPCGFSLRRGRIGTLFHPEEDVVSLNMAYVEISQLRLGFFSGEFLADWEGILRPLTTAPTMLSSYLSGPPTYVATTSNLPEGGYEVSGFQTAFGLKGRLDELAQPKIERLFAKLANERVSSHGQGRN